MSQPNDSELLAAWKNGNDAAGNQLFEAYFPALYRFFRSKLSSATEVEDLVQKTFLGCVESLAVIDGSSFRAYLFTLARHRLVDFFRGRYRLGKDLDCLTHSVVDIAASPSQILNAAQEQAMLAEALRRIPLDFQIALELAYWEDLSAPEIAEVLQIPSNTVRSRLSRGRDYLRIELEKLSGDPASAKRTMDQLDLSSADKSG